MIDLPALSVAWTLVLLVITLLFIYGVWPHGFFKKLGVPGPRPWPFFGTLLSYTKGLCNFDMECAKKYGKVWGIYDGRLPILMVTDLEMIKVIMVKECYSNFINRRKRTTGLAGPFADGIIMVKDERWKRMRSTLSPYFTSGRLKEIFPIAVTHADRFIKNMQKKDNKQPVKVKEVVAPYSLDVVTSSSFSVDIDSINNADDPFVTNIKKFIQFNMFNPLFLLILLFPSIAIILKKMGVTLFSKSSMDFFYSAVKKIKDEHNKESDGRVDFLQLMLQNQIPGDHFEDTDEQPAKGLTDHEILSQYPLNTPITYDALMKIDYLEMAINESMRLLPTAPRLERVCKKTVELNGVTIPKDTLVGIPTYVLCRDPQLWESPDEFRPERFSPESKSEINQYAFLPFGLGPRNCIGMRFALMIMKLLVVKLLQNFSMETCKETQIPLEMNAAFQPKVPITLKFIPRSHKAKQ
ncbi:cytochrome P450 3A27-like [Sinocyclocheilus rhinocerous]|uniref:cytochrome P450 3A27-like n=1 Tax=Sinocyclocheilus rhinocerous TaxID=307959 RepID=UPI0007BA123A|nr:PREDICTED: cytochrome P450 3A27-like [Sinocyclocheilus rhinocerous]